MESKTDEQRKRLEELGNELTKIQFDFKIKNNSSEKYWVKRIEEFDKYHKKAIEYFSQAYSMMSDVDKEQAGMFLLRISKLKQLGVKLSENMERIRQNPSIMNVKDKQQSKWSLEQKELLMNVNEECLSHEKKMNLFFREFCDKNIR